MQFPSKEHDRVENSFYDTANTLREGKNLGLTVVEYVEAKNIFPSTSL